MMLSLIFTATLSQVTPTAFAIDVSHVTPISRYIYGVNSPSWAGADFPYTVGRLGGNRMTAYNWETNASNAGSDWHNQNDGFMGTTDEAGWTMRNALAFDEAHHAATIMTIPTAGYVAADKKGDGDVNQTPNYLETRFFKSLPSKGSKLTYPPDLTDRVVYQDECVAWLEKIKSPNEPLWFMLDNEPDLWGSTHSRIWPKAATYAQIIENNITYAKAIKAVAPDALVFGPANYGWGGFHTFQGASDANGRDFLDTYLDAMSQVGSSAGKRLLDALDIHWYPEAQGGGVRVTEGDKQETAEARIQAPRSLWDTTYVEKSWIADSLGGKPIVLLPTILKQIDTHYPGTKFSISEYNYGGNKTISGAIAEADVLGIFGRYRLFSACNWGIGKDDVGQIAGFRAFINFDGKGGHFLDREAMVSGGKAASSSVYVSVDSKDPKHLVIVAINKRESAMPVTFNLGSSAATGLKSYTITSDHLTSPVAQSPVPHGNTFDFNEPALSVTTFDVTLA
jgi:hypothetical protein